MLQLIDEMGLAPGDAIPGEPDLARMFDVGRSTVREALVFLENEGLIERSQGARTTLTALARWPAMGLEALEPVEALAERQGWRCGTRDIVIKPARANLKQAKRLCIEPGSDLTVITRVKTLDGKPFAYMISEVSQHVAPSTFLQREFTDSITRLIEQQYKLRYAKAEVAALACPADVARKLELRRGAPIVELTELFYGDDELPLKWSVNYLVPGAMRLEILRKASSGNPARRWSEDRGAGRD